MSIRRRVVEWDPKTRVGEVVQQREGIWLHQARRWRASIQGEGFKSLTEGDRVEFNLVDGEEGPAAENVSPLEN